ncbi:MAG: TonB-dependent receptor [Endomicrobiia bacterium]
MKKEIILFCSLLFSYNIFCSEVYLDIEKVGKRKDNVLYEKFDSEKIIISKEEIEKFQLTSLSELLRLYGFDTYVRSNAQSDITFYGGTFQQVSVLVNGVNVSDKQTAHHSLNIPINLNDIERIEITKNGQRNLGGMNSNFGSVNIITKKDIKLLAENKLKTSYGSNDTFSFAVNKRFKNNFLSTEYESSYGYKKNTDYKIFNIYFQNANNFKDFDLTYSIGYLDKKFGAENFYAVNRTEYEEIKTLLTMINTKYSFEKLKLYVDGMFRFGEDYYTTFRYEPENYYNNHRTYIYLINTKGVLSLVNNFDIVFGLDNRYDDLDSRGSSTRLPTWRGMGKFSDLQTGLYTQFIKKYKAFDIATNFRTDWYFSFGEKKSYEGQKNSYGIDLEFVIIKNLKLFTSYNQSVRLPSYTELFYWDPNNTGSLDLKVEKTQMYDVGTKVIFNNIFFIAKGFRTNIENLIDWTRNVGTTVWRIDNIAESNANGLDFGAEVFSKNNSPRIRVNTIILDKKVDLPSGKELKYADNWPEQYYSIMLFPEKFYDINSNVSLVYKKMKKTNPEEFFLLDIALSRDIFNTNVFVKVKNVLDTQYEELPNIPQPGRQIFMGIEYKF